MGQGDAVPEVAAAPGAEGCHRRTEPNRLASDWPWPRSSAACRPPAGCWSSTAPPTKHAGRQLGLVLHPGPAERLQPDVRAQPLPEQSLRAPRDPRVVPRPAHPRSLRRPLGGEVRFEQVSFSYPGSGTPALEDVSFLIAPGETIAVVGRNGAGKSNRSSSSAGCTTPAPAASCSTVRPSGVRPRRAPSAGGGDVP